MLKSQRDSIISGLGSEDRKSIQTLVSAIKEARGNSPDLGKDSGRVSARELLQEWQAELPQEAREALEAILTRDETGPKVGEFPDDFSLKRLGSEERVRLSDFRGEQPVALAFGSYT